MLKTTIVTTKEELFQIHNLNQQNLKHNLDKETQNREGFVTWLYSMELLQKMHNLSPSIIVKDETKVVAYALTTLKEARSFHPDLDIMFRNLESVQYKNRALSSFVFIAWGKFVFLKIQR